MLTYLLLAGNDGAPVSPELIARFTRDDPVDVPFRPDERIVWSNRDGSVVFVGWQAFAELGGIGSHWAVDDRGLTAFTGYCWPAATGWVHGSGQSWASQLRAWLDRRPELPAVREELYGQFTVIMLDNDGSGWAMPDFAGFDQLFVAESPDLTAVSNRAGLCARAITPDGQRPDRSPAGAGWLIGEGHMLDQESGYWDVERPDAGSMVAFRPRSGARMAPPRYSPLRPPNPHEPQPTYAEILDENERVLRRTMHAIAALPVDDLELTLSGGVDSRTLTAAILSEGLQARFRFVTNGSPERADVIVARSIAERFGLDWSLRDPSARPAEEEIDNALIHSGLTEGMTSAWGIFDRPAYSTSATVSGVAGEGMRWKWVAGSAIDATSIADVNAALRARRPIDPLKVLRPDVRAYYQDSVDTWVHDLVQDGTPIASIPALYMHERLVHSRNGPDYGWSPRLLIAPYITPANLRANHRLALDQRPSNAFHLDLQRRFCMDLSTMPLADAVWPEETYRDLPDADLYRRNQPVHSLNPDGRTWRQRRYADYRPFIEEYVLDAANPLADLVDRDRLIDRVASGDANAGRTRHIWGLLTAAIWLGAHERHIPFERS